MAGQRGGALAALRLLVLGLTALGASIGLATPDAFADEPPQENPSCLAFTAEARYRGIGYEHLVHIANACEKAANCRVTTDVNPSVMEARVEKRTVLTVITYRGSPASTFVANVQCTLAD